MTIGDLERWMRAKGEARVTIFLDRDGEFSVSLSSGYFSVHADSRYSVSQALDNALADFQEQQNEFDSAPKTQKIKRVS